MPSTYTSNNKIQKIATGEQSGTWGSTTNTNFDLFDTAIDGFVAVAVTGTTTTLNIPDGSAADGRNKVLSFTGALSAANTVSVTPNTVKKHYFVQNNTTGSQNIIIYQGSGSTVTVKPGYSSIVYLDGAGGSASAKEVLTSLKLTALLEATGVVFVGSTSGSTTLQATATASGTLTLPAATDTLVGKATTDTFTNKTLDTAGTGNVLRINGTQVSAVTGTGSVVLATSPTLVTPAIGTPTSGTLTSCTGLPISTGVSGLGSGVATFLATPSSSNLAAAVTDETGTGALVFATSPTIATPTITTSAVIPLVNGGTAVSSTLTLQSTSGAGTSDAIIFKTASQSEKMRILTDGKVGIGTATPGTKISFGNSTAEVDLAGTKISVFDAAGECYGIGLSKLSTNYGLGLYSASLIASGVPKVFIENTGNVGIGTTSPATALEVFGSITARVATTQDSVIVAGRAGGTSGFGVTLTPTTLTASRTVTLADGNTTLATGTMAVTGGTLAQFAATTSAQLAGVISDETGTGALVFATSPTIATPTVTTSAVIPIVNGGTAASSTLTLQSTSGAGSSDAIIFKTASQSERMRITTAGDVNIGGGTNAGDTLRYFDLYNTNTGSSAGSIVRIITSDAAGTGSALAQIVKYKNGTMSIQNTETSATGLMSFWVGASERMRIDSAGNVGIGLPNPAYKLEIVTDSAGKPGVGGLWTVVSDERIKTDITPADLDRCYEIVKSVPLKHFGFAPGVYTDDQIQDKHNLGWIAQDVQRVFSKAVSVKPFTLKTAIPDGTEEYTEQDFTVETVEKTETSIQVIDGKPVQVSKVVTSENKVLLFDTVDVVDEAGAVVMDGDKPLTYQMPRMVTKTRNKVRHDVIEDCLDLNGGQMIAALYGAVQALMLQVESLKAGN